MLRRRGWRLVARRLQTPAAEVDLLFRAGSGLVCVEVKTGRLGSRFRPGHRLDARRLARLRSAARYLARRGSLRARVDLVEVALVERDVRILHHEGIERPLD